MEEMPSSYDDNESKAVIDLAVAVRVLDCTSQESSLQIENIDRSLQWIYLYSDLKGSNDILSVLMIVDSTLDGLRNKEFSAAYCELKKKSLVTQTDSIARAAFRRYQ